MPVFDTAEFDFSHEHGLGPAQSVVRTTLVHNEDAHAVLHIGVKLSVPWLDIYPAEFALAPHGAQTLTIELHPERAQNQALAMTQVALFGQYIALDAADADTLPQDIDARIGVIPPIAACPHCAADLPEGARECRRCGERIRLCPICGTPNTWPARICRLNPVHVLRTEMDWLSSPGGDPTHALAPKQALGIHLARRWSSPPYPPARDAHALEWSAPLAAFGMIIASAIDTQAGRATVQAFETSTGAALWEYDLSDLKGIYPDRGAMALSPDGTLYAATLGGQITALDVIRGTRMWAGQIRGTVYGGVTVGDDALLVPAGSTLCVLDRATGAARHVLPLDGRLDTAPAYAVGVAFCTCDDAGVYAFDVQTGARLWRAEADGPFDAAPLIHDGIVYAASIAGSVFAFDAFTGERRWQTAITPKGISCSPALSADGLLFVAADDGFVHILAAVGGSLIRSRRVSATPLRSAPVCSGQTVFVGADDGSVYALDADYTVQRVYETTPGARLASAGFALYGDTLAVTGTNGLLYVLRATA